MWEDITQQIRDASSCLSDSNPMVYSENFSLFEAMSAIEVIYHFISLFPSFKPTIMNNFTLSHNLIINMCSC